MVGPFTILSTRHGFNPLGSAGHRQVDLFHFEAQAKGFEQGTMISGSDEAGHETHTLLEGVSGGSAHQAPYRR